MYIPRIILAFLVPAVFAQYHTRETRTPSLDFLHTVFGKEALNELPNDDEVARLASLEWARCETDSTKRPFLACTTSTSESVQTLLTEVPLYIPLMNDGNRTCFVVHETKDRVLEVLVASLGTTKCKGDSCWLLESDRAASLSAPLLIFTPLPANAVLKPAIEQRIGSLVAGAHQPSHFE